jgi:hypothetical protein
LFNHTVIFSSTSTTSTVVTLLLTEGLDRSSIDVETRSLQCCVIIFSEVQSLFFVVNMMKNKTTMTGIMMSWWLAIGLVVPAYFSYGAGSTVFPFRQSNVSTTTTADDQTLHGIVDWMKNERQALDEEFWKNQNDESYLNGDIQSDTGNAGKQHSKGYRRKLQTSTGCATTRTQIVTLVSGGVKRITVCASRTTFGGAARRRNLKESDEDNHHRELTRRSRRGINLSNRNVTFVCVLRNREMCILDGQGRSQFFYGTNTRVTLNGFVLFNGYSDDKVMGGAALSFIDSNVHLYKSTVSHNKGKMGGAIAMSNSSLTTCDVQFQDNVGKVGGAIYGINSDLRTFPRSSTQMLRNRATDDGGAIYMIGGEVSLENSFMSNNTASNSVSICIVLLFLKVTNRSR